MKIAIVSLVLVAGLGATGAGVAPRTMEVLPLGTVRAEKWLLTQLERQREGLTGHAEELYDDIGHSDWLTGAKKGGQYDWERGPYYAKGLVALAFTLDDAQLKERARRWADAVLKSQRANGDFGPKVDNWWANMIALHYLRDWCEATGDERVMPFLRRYFEYQAKRLPQRSFLADSAWACCRVGDELEVVMWLYDRTQDATLLDFARLISAQTADWTTFYHEGGDGGWKQGYRSHIVNYMQGLKFPAIRSRLTGDERDRTAYAAAFSPEGWAMRMHGRVDRMVNGTEPLSGRGAGQGTELCAIAERILACRDVISATGEMQAADDLEVVAFNSLPSTLGDDGRGLRYYQRLNQPMCTTKTVMGFNNNGHGEAYTPGPDAGFGCCRSNFHFAWPKFVQSLWMAKEGGLAAVAYAPSKVTTATATIRTSGAYPFGDGVTLEILAAKGGTWPLFVRVPGWSRGTDIRVNGVSVEGAVAGTFCRLDRAWKTGDKVELTFPAEVRVEAGINGSVAVRRGPLVYALKLDADIKTLPVKKGREGYPVREYRPKEAWNRALLLKDAQTLEATFKPAATEPKDPFVHGAKPCSLKVRAGFTRYGGWGTMQCGFTAHAVEPPPSPLASGKVTDVSEIELVPLGSTQIRITLFPWGRDAEASFEASTNRVLFLLVGQSNMAGRAKPCDRDAIPGVYKLNRDGRWVPATSPVHFDKSIAGVGPVESFVRDYRRDHPEVAVGLVPCAVGGTAMSTWCVSSNGVVGVNLKRALERVKTALPVGRFVGVLWHQGEADAGRFDAKTLAGQYPRQFASMVSSVRGAVGDAALPVVVGEIGRFNPDMAAKMNPVLNSLSEQVECCACVSSEDLKNQDQWHFDKAAVKELGRRYYKAWKNLAEKDDTLRAVSGAFSGAAK